MFKVKRNLKSKKIRVRWVEKKINNKEEECFPIHTDPIFKV